MDTVPSLRVERPIENDDDVQASPVGGVNGDGHQDLLFSNHPYDANGVEDSGRAWLVLGRSASTTLSWAEVEASAITYDGWDFSRAAGRRPAANADVPVDELYVIPAQGPGAIVVATEDRNAIPLPQDVRTDSGWLTVATAGDVDGNGLDDLVVDIPSYDSVPGRIRGRRTCEPDLPGYVVERLEGAVTGRNRQRRRRQGDRALTN
ncbi:MAG: hypothetical protein ACR2HR_12625 [Euzebya sp.]